MKHGKNAAQILNECERIAADILVLTETDERISPDYNYVFHTGNLQDIAADFYMPTERRVSIYTNYPCVTQHETYDAYTAACVELATELGNLLVYGTIMGLFGNRNQNYREDLRRQIDDFRRLSMLGNFCIAGDFNCSFGDNYYFTKEGRGLLLNCFAENKLSLLTEKVGENVDHIAISESFYRGGVVIEEWNQNRALSDHKGIAVSFE